MKEMKGLFKNHMGNECKKVMYTLFNSNPMMPMLFGFVKTHKKENLMRLSLKGGLLHRMGEWILLEQKKIICKGKLLLSSTGEMIDCAEDLNKKNKEVLVIVSLDIKSIYPSIPIDEGIEILKEIMRRKRRSQNLKKSKFF